MAQRKHTSPYSEDALQCSLCKSDFTDPRLLPCLHTFCLKCLKQHKAQMDLNKNPFCPVCRTEFSVPYEDLEKLQTNNIIARLILAKNIPEGKEGKSKCTSDCENMDAEVFCINCKKYFCFNCKNAHDKWHKTHKVVGIEERQTDEELQIMNSNTCLVHKEDIVLYCSDCKKLLCHKCHAQGHDKHPCKKLSDAAKLKKNEISEYRSNLEKRIKDKTTTKENQKTKANLCLEEISAAKKDIENSISEIIEHILSKKGEFLTALENLEETYRRTAESSKCDENTSESVGAEFSGVVSYTEMVVERGTECEVIEAADELQSKAEELMKLLDKPTEHEADQNCRFLTPVSSEISKLKNQIFETDILRILDSAINAHEKGHIYEEIGPVSDHQESRWSNKPVEHAEISLSGSLTSQLEFTTVSGINVMIDQGNIVNQTVEVIVNAANIHLVHGSGVAGAIKEACGKELETESKKYIREYGNLEIGKPMHTTSGKLSHRVKYVVHVAGPNKHEVKNEQTCQRLLFNSFYNCFLYSNERLRAKSIAIPAISSGIYGVPLSIVAQCSWDALVKFDSYMQEQKEKERHLKQIIFVNIDDKTVSAMYSSFCELLKGKHDFKFISGRQPAYSSEDRPRRVLISPDKPAHRPAPEPPKSPYRT